MRVWQRIIEKLQLEVSAPTGTIKVGCTVGIALCPSDAANPRGLITVADRLMYMGKKSGRNRVVTVDELEDEARRSLSEATGLRG